MMKTGKVVEFVELYNRWFEIIEIIDLPEKETIIFIHFKTKLTIPSAT